MAKINLLFQAVTTDFHAAALRKLLSVPKVERLVASVAFVREDGVNAVAAELKKLAHVSTFFVGIRNGITSIQAMKCLLRLGVRVFAVDTASRSTIFHPKVFVAKGKIDASAIIGSANMTFNGLHNNIEAGAILDLNLAENDDANFVDSTLKILDKLATRYPKHVFEIDDVAAAESLFNDGRLVDEDVVIAPSANTSVREGERDNLTPMDLFRHRSPARRRKRIKPKEKTTRKPPSIPSRAPAVEMTEFILIWESRGLTERDLTIPTGSTTHATGSMLWKKGAADEIDQRHFFRDEAFAGLDWQVDPTKPHLERAEADFQVVIKGLNYGMFRLRLSHNTDTTTRTYAQRNSMTQIHWGIARPHIAKRDLLNRVMSLYRKEGDTPEFKIEID